MAVCLAFQSLVNSFQPWVVMVLPAGGFFALAGLVVVVQLDRTN